MELQFFPLKGYEEDAFEIYKSNSFYFLNTLDRIAEEKDIIEDSLTFPKGHSATKKHYKLFGSQNEIIGVLDYLEDYPSNGTVHIGLYMLKEKFQRKGFGRTILLEVEKKFWSQGIQRIQLGVLEENERAFSFWQKEKYQIVAKKIWMNPEGMKNKIILMEKWGKK